MMGKLARFLDEGDFTGFWYDVKDLMDVINRTQDVSSGIATFVMPENQTQAGPFRYPGQAFPMKAHPSWQESMPFTEVYGRDEEKQKIIELLLTDEFGVEFIPIVGTGGVGKTSLAQCVYNDDCVVSHFDIKAWVSVPEGFDVNRVTAKLNKSATQGFVNCTNPKQSQEFFKMLLSGKRFLIVLDDVLSSNYNDWELLQNLFSRASNGSKVIITTRSEKIARMVIKNPTRSPIIELSGLSDDSSWLLFQKLVGEVVEQEMHDVIKVCRGLPFAVKIVAGLLRSVDKSNWPRILKELESQGVGIVPILRLTYSYLPAILKQLFAYCSIFPEDFVIDEKKLIFMWMAESFLPEIDSMEMEDAGHKYILDLKSRFFFDPIPSGEGLFTMHKLIHDLAQWAAGDSCCLMDYGKNFSRARHISFTEDAKDEAFGTLATLQATHKVRTVVSFIRDPGCSRFNMLDVTRFSYLHVLSLACAKFSVSLDIIGQLPHLRYLDLSFTEINELPRSIGKILNLQTLLLRHCDNLQSLPKSIILLIGLRHIDVFGTSLQQMPVGFGELKNLRTLNRFVLGAGRGRTISELKNMKYLRLLYISGLENMVGVDDAVEAKLDEKSYLLELHLYWGSSITDVDDNTKRSILEQLRPSTSIKKCCLDGYSGLIFPAWLGDPAFTNLVDLRLVGCEMLEWLPPLGHLPSLKDLWIEGMHGIKRVGSEFYGSSKPFPALRTLAFYQMKSWEEWLHSSVDNNWAFPLLKKLSIMGCPLLHVCLPPHLPSLEVLDIKYCYELKASLPTLPLLEELEIEQCKELLRTTEAISCSRMMKLGYIYRAISLPGSCPDFLEELCIFSCDKLYMVDQIPKMLRRLKIYDCLELHSVECGEILLEQVIIHNCFSLTSLFSSSVPKKGKDVSRRDSFELVHLTQLTISQCPSLTSLPKGLLLPHIKELEFSNCENIEALPSQMHQYTSLKRLIVFDCPKILSFSCGVLPKNLTSLRISRVNLQQPIQEWGLHHLTSLQFLELNDVGCSSEFLKCIPDSNLPLPLSLSSLYIGEFPKLKCINCHLLPNLTTLTVHSCPEFRSLSDNCKSHPKFWPRSKLWEVNIRECPMFEC